MALNNVPQATQSLNQTQAPILQNFSVIDTAFAINHVTYNDPNQGKHNFVSMPVQLASPVTAAAELALFSRTSTLSTIPEMAFRREANGSVIEFTSGLLAAVGWTRLPSGILLKWGSASANGLTTYTFPVAATIPAFTAIYSIQITTSYVNATDSPNGFVRLNNFIAPWTDFSVFGSSRTSAGALAVTYQYLAIGV